MRGQGLATGAGALGFGHGGTGLFIGLLDFCFKRGEVFIVSFFEQIPL